MCIIIYYSASSDAALVFKATVCSGKIMQSLNCHGAFYSEQVGKCNCCERIAHIVAAGDTEGKFIGHAVCIMQKKGGMTKVIIVRYIPIIICAGAVRAFFRGRTGNYPAYCAFRNLSEIWNLTVYYQTAGFGKEHCKAVKGSAYIVNILEKVEMILLYVEDYPYFWR